MSNLRRLHHVVRAVEYANEHGAVTLGLCRG
jgi:hypothetical protein